MTDPAVRALLLALDEWVSTGKSPPPSHVPRVTNGTAVLFEQIKFPKAPGFVVPGLVAPPGDNKTGVAGSWVDPLRTTEAIHATRLPAVDADGNETSV